MTLLGMGVYALWRNQPRPRLPAVPLAGIDPEVAATVRDSEDAVRRAPASGPNWGKLGLVLYVHDFKQQATTCFAEAERLEPQEPRWPYFRGLCLLYWGPDPNRALPDLTRAAALTGASPEAPRLLLAETLLNQGRPDDAQPLLRQALRHDPDSTRALLGLGRLALSRGQLTQAHDELSRSLQIAPNVKSTHLLLALTLQRQGNAAAAATVARQAATLPDAPAWPDPFLDEASALQVGQVAQIQRGEILIVGGQFYDAVALMEKTVKEYPNSGRAWTLLGAGYTGCGDPKDGEKALRRAVALGPKSAETLNHLGNALARQGRDHEAAQYFREALALNPQSAEYHFNLGVCQFRQHDTAGAVKQFQTTLRLDPNTVKGRAGLADALTQAHQTAAAVKQLRDALRLSPGDPILIKSLSKLTGTR